MKTEAEIAALRKLKLQNEVYFSLIIKRIINKERNQTVV